jgi:hypothetical protein
MSLIKIITAASRRVNAAPWWRLSVNAQQELAAIAGVPLAAWRQRWETRLERNRKRRR